MIHEDTIENKIKKLNRKQMEVFKKKHGEAFKNLSIAAIALSTAVTSVALAFQNLSNDLQERSDLCSITGMTMDEIQDYYVKSAYSIKQLTDYYLRTGSLPPYTNAENFKRNN